MGRYIAQDRILLRGAFIEQGDEIELTAEEAKSLGELVVPAQDTASDAGSTEAPKAKATK